MINMTVTDFFDYITDKKNSSFLVLGAGPKGIGVYLTLVRYQIKVTIVDLKYNYFRLYDIPTQPIESININDYDIVFVTSHSRRDYYQKAIDDADKKLIPVFYIEEDTSKQLPDISVSHIYKYTDFPACDTELFKISPLEFISPTRYDLVIKYIAAREILSGNFNGIGKELYFRLVEWMCAGKEYNVPLSTCSFFSAYEEKKGLDTFHYRFTQLADSMKTNGFDKRHFIPVSENNNSLNGAHRISCAICLGIDVYAKKYIGYGEPFFVFDIQHMEKIGYSQEQLSYLQTVFSELIDKKAKITKRIFG